MSIKPVTVSQGEQVRKMATDKGISASRFQKFGLDNGNIAAALDAIRQDPPINLRIPVVRLPCVNICTIKVWADLRPDRDWTKMVKGACSKTKLEPSSIWDVGAHYPSTGEGLVEEEITLLNFDESVWNDDSWGRVHHWAETFRLEETDPAWVFGLALDRPNLQEDLGYNWLWVVATKGCSHQGNHLACFEAWDVEREPCTQFTSAISHLGVWFAFRKKR